MYFRKSIRVKLVTVEGRAQFCAINRRNSRFSYYWTTFTSFRPIYTIFYTYKI